MHEELAGSKQFLKPRRGSEHHVRATLELARHQDAHAGFGIFNQGTDSAGHVEQGAEWAFVDNPQRDCWGATNRGHQGDVREGHPAARGADTGEEKSPSCGPHKNGNPELDGNCEVGKGRMRDNGAKADGGHAVNGEVECIPDVTGLLLD